MRELAAWTHADRRDSFFEVTRILLSKSIEAQMHSMLSETFYRNDDREKRLNAFPWIKYLGIDVL